MMNQKTKKRLGQVFKWICLSLALAVVGVNLYTANAEKLTGNAMPMPFGFAASVVLSDSMQPTLHAGDLIFVVRQDAYEAGDIVVFQDGRSATVHRIRRINGETAVTAGDGNLDDFGEPIEDPPIHIERIKGKVVGSVPYVGFLVNFIKTPIVTLFLVAAAVLLVRKSIAAERAEKQREIDFIKEEIRRLKDENDQA